MPISKRIKRAYPKTARFGGRLLWSGKSSIAQISKNDPWKISPNMTPKRKGKVTIANIAGLTSLKVGMP